LGYHARTFKASFRCRPLAEQFFFGELVQMALSKFLACTIGAVIALAAAACADGTGSALTPTLPTATSTEVNADGTRLKASAPQPTSPISATRVSTLTPTLHLANATGTFDSSSQLAYVFEVSEGSTVIYKSDPIAAAGGETTFTVPADVLQHNKTYSWNAYAIHSGVAGSKSDVVTFRSPVPPAPPADRPGPVFCAGSSGPEIIQCVARAYPEKLVSTSTGDFSDERRAANMEFIRDRIIETGLCKGLNLGQNFKRGTPEISRDFIVLRSNRGKNGRDRGVDIARGYDNNRERLQLAWQVFDADENWGHPFYKNYGPVDCSAVQ
jgi:hypothetical protein